MDNAQKTDKGDVCPGKKDKLELADVQARLSEATGPRYWRTLDELAQTPEFEEMLHREFPRHASEWTDKSSRRDFMKIMGASLALAGMSACTRQPLEPIVPYVKQPANLVPGKPLFYATAMALGAYGTGAAGGKPRRPPDEDRGQPAASQLAWRHGRIHPGQRADHVRSRPLAGQ